MNLQKKLILWIISIIVFFALIITSYVLIINSGLNVLEKSLCVVLISLNWVFFVGLVMWFKFEFTRNERLVQNSINSYIENIISTISIGVIIFQPNGKIVWASNFIYERFGKNVVNQHLNSIIPNVTFEQSINEFEQIIFKNEFVFQAKFIMKDLIVVIKDITQEYSSTHYYEVERPVIGEVDIDNFQQYRSSLSGEDLFLIQTTIINTLESLSKKYNLSYKQYSEDKFILFTNRDNLNKMILSKFYEFDELHKLEIIKNIHISLSIGFGVDSSNFSKLMEMAKEGLKQSQSRGGDQITIISDVEKPKHFGSKSEIAILKSRTKIKNVASNLKIALQDNQIKNVIIYGHKMADLDAIGAAYAMYEIATAYGKEVNIQNNTFDDTSKKAIEKYIKNPSKVFVSPSKANILTNKNTLIIIVDCADETRVENPKVFQKTDGKNIFVFDHHRISKLNDIIDQLNVYVETSASSASEVITEVVLFNQFQKHLSQNAIQMLLNGIYLDTSQFRKNVSTRTFYAASLLEDWGANVEESVAILKISQETNELLNKVLSNIQEIKPGYWLAVYPDEVAPDVIAIAADEILKIADRKAAFVIAKQPKKNNFENDVYKLSARSIKVNVQLIAEAVGGGGHFNAAAAISDGKNKESLETFVDNVIQAIISIKEG